MNSLLTKNIIFVCWSWNIRSFFHEQPELTTWLTCSCLVEDLFPWRWWWWWGLFFTGRNWQNYELCNHTLRNTFDSINSLILFLNQCTWTNICSTCNKIIKIGNAGLWFELVILINALEDILVRKLSITQYSSIIHFKVVVHKDDP